MSVAAPPARAVFPFMALPTEIRLAIYSLALDYPDLRRVFNKFEAVLRQKEERQELLSPICIVPAPHVPAETRTTPSILLCSRQITQEALEVRQSKVLTLKRAAPYTNTRAGPMDITEFISEETLQSVRKVVFKMDLTHDVSAWSGTIDTLLDVWAVRNSLQMVQVTVRGLNSNSDALVNWVDLGDRLTRRALYKLQSFMEAESIEFVRNYPTLHFVRQGT